ncbi:Pectate lyase A, partial [Clarias magur]
KETPKSNHLGQRQDLAGLLGHSSTGQDRTYSLIHVNLFRNSKLSTTRTETA